MTELNKQSPEQNAQQATRYYRAGTILYVFTVALVLNVVYYLIQDLSRVGQPTFQTLVYAAGVPSFYACGRMLRRGRPVRAVAVGLLAAILIGLVNVTSVSGQAIFLTVMVSLIFGSVAIYVFPKEEIGPALVIIVLAALVLPLADALWPFPRPQLPAADQTTLYLLSGLILLAVGFLLVRSFSGLSLGTKLLVILLLVSLLPLVLLATLNSIASRRILIEDANRVLAVAATQTANDVDTFIEQGLADAAAEARVLELTHAMGLLRGEEVTAAGLEGVVNHLHVFRDKSPLEIQSVALLGLDGRVLVDTAPDNEGQDESGRSYFLATLESNRPYASPVEFPPDASGPVIYFSAPVQDAEGNIMGVLRTRYDATIIQNIVARNTGLVGGESYGILVDDNLMELAHGRDRESLYKILAPAGAEEVAALQAAYRLPEMDSDALTLNEPDLAEKLRNATMTPFFTAEDILVEEQTNRVAVVSLATQPWQVSYFQPQEAFLAPVTAQSRNTLLLGTMIVALVAGFAVIASRYLVQPIEELTATASRIATGELDARVRVTAEDEIGTLAATFNSMTGQLQNAVAALEERVAARTRALETTAQISRSVSAILNEDELAQQLVRQVCDGFDYYYVQFYLYDEATERLVLVAGDGKPGPSKRARQHSLAIGQGLVGRAAFTNTPVLVGNTGESADWVYNPDLPDTRSEVAVPISIGQQVLGVLDVQEDAVNALQQEDADVLQTFANQVAVALRNARLYEESQQRAEREIKINTIAQRIQQTTEIETALQVAARELGRATGERRVSIRLKDEGAHGNGRKEGGR